LKAALAAPGEQVSAKAVHEFLTKCHGLAVPQIYEAALRTRMSDSRAIARRTRALLVELKKEIVRTTKRKSRLESQSAVGERGEAIDSVH